MPSGPKIIITGDPLSPPDLIWLISLDGGATYGRATVGAPPAFTSNNLRADFFGPIGSLLAGFVGASSIQIQKPGTPPTTLKISKDASNNVVWELNGSALDKDHAAYTYELPPEFMGFKLSQMTTGGIPVYVASLCLQP